MSQLPLVVYDCNIFIQALININGPAGRCIRHALGRDVALVLSNEAIHEIRQAPTKRTPARLGVTVEKTELLIRDLLKIAVMVQSVGSDFVYPRDPDDAHYVNLALTAQAQTIVSRDNDLLSLMDASRPDGKDFQTRFPHIRVVDPVVFLRELDANKP